MVTIESLGRRALVKDSQGLRLNTVPEVGHLRWLWPAGILFSSVAIAHVSSSYDNIILSGGVDSRLYRMLPKRKLCPIITSPSARTVRILTDNKSAREHTKCFIAQSEGIAQVLRDVGVEDDRIVEMYPLVDATSRRGMPHSCDRQPKRVLFASSPHFIDKDTDNYYEKGVDLLLDSFSAVVNAVSAELIILWRRHSTDRLIKDVEKRGLVNHVEVVDGMVNVNDYYDSVDMVVVPYRSLWRSPAIPLSGVEALFRGIPLVLTDVSELSDLVRRYRCGEVSSATSDDLSRTICRALSSLETYREGIAEFQDWYLCRQTESLQSLARHIRRATSGE